MQRLGAETNVLRQLVAADLDGDGDVDVATARPRRNRLERESAGRGRGRLRAARQVDFRNLFVWETYFLSLAAEDLDGTAISISSRRRQGGPPGTRTG